MVLRREDPQVASGPTRRRAEPRPRSAARREDVPARTTVAPELPDAQVTDDQARGLFATLFGATPDASVVVSPEGTILAWNAAAERLYGIRAQDALGSSFAQRVVTDAQDAVNIARVLAGERIQPYEVSRRGGEGRSVRLQVTHAVSADATGRVVAVVELARPVSPPTNDAAEVQRLRGELRRRQEDFDQFVYIASHDLQEPLRMVASYCHLLELRYKGKLEKDADDFIGFAVDGAVRMRRLLNDLLRFSRIETNGKPPRPADAGQALARAIETVASALETTKGKIDAGPMPQVLADSEQLVQLFQLLLENSIKFRADAPPRIHVTAERSDGEWTFTVQDNGIGIDPKFTDRMFVLFQRLNGPKYEGTGIGLAIAKRIVQRHGGRIWLAPAAGAGTTFRFTLPDATALSTRGDA